MGIFISPTLTTTESRSANPRARTVRSLVGTHKAGDSDNPPHFYEPGGLSVAADRLYVADTNNDKIRVVDLRTDAVKTLDTRGLVAPQAGRSKTGLSRTPRLRRLARSCAGRPDRSPSAVSVSLPEGFKLNEETPLTWLVEVPGKSEILGPELRPEGQHIKPPDEEVSKLPSHWQGPRKLARSWISAFLSRLSSAARSRVCA